MDWPVAGSDAFMVAAIAALIAAPLVGISGGWSRLRPTVIAALGLALLLSLGGLAWCWRDLPSGLTAALFGHAALVISVLTMAEIGRVARTVIRDPLSAALAAVTTSVVLIAGIFAAGPIMGDVPSTQSAWLLMTNPLVTVTSAAGIDFLHLDAIYHTSPLAHRGVALPAWTAACGLYAVAGLVAHGGSRLLPGAHKL